MTSSIRNEEQVFGGGGGESFNDSHDVDLWGRVSQIVVRHGNRVDSIGICYENGNFLEHGGTGGHETRIVLEAGEHIVGIRGRAGVEVDQLTFISSRRTYGPYGGSGGNPFDVDFGGKALHYVCGRAGGRLDQIAFGYGDPPPELVSSIVPSGRHGGMGGGEFNDLGSRENPLEKIAAITVRHGAMIDQLSVQYRGRPTTTHGGGGGHSTTFSLDDDEWLTEVRGRAGNRLDQVQFVTSKARYSPVFGGNGGKPFTLRMDDHIIKAFFGRAGKTIDQLGVFFEAAKPIKVHITAMDYDLERARIIQMPPVAMMTTLLENSTSVSQQVEQRVSVTTTSSESTSIVENHGVSVDLTVSKEFAFVKAELKVGYTYSRSTTTESSKQTSTANDFAFTAVVPPGGAIKATCVARKETFDVPWTATAQVTYRDRAEPVEETLHGRLVGIQCTALEAKYEPLDARHGDPAAPAQPSQPSP